MIDRLIGDQLWDRIEALFAREVPDMKAALRPPATQSQLEAAESHFGVRLPDDIRHAYLRHDGCVGSGGKSNHLLAPYFDWRPLEDCVDQWDILKRLYDESSPDEDMYPTDEENWPTAVVRPWLGSPLWIPFGGTNTESCLCIDMHPGPAGIVGQLIESSGFPEFYSPSFDAYLNWLALGLADGSVRYERTNREWVQATSAKWISIADVARATAV
jgi:cell wall assembly regulator SMI1